MNLLFSSDNVNILLQTNGKRDRRPNFFPLFFFVCLFFLFFGLECFNFWWCVVMVWNRKSCLGPTEIISFGFLVVFKDWGRRVSRGFIFLYF